MSAGLELCRRLYVEAVAPLLIGLPHAAARIDAGSELLGFDTARSRDHDWGPRVQVFTDDPQVAASIAERLADLPERVAGYPARFRAAPGTTLGLLDPDGDRHGVSVESLAAFLTRRLGHDPRVSWTAADWRATPTQRLAELTGGAVYADPGGELAALRRALGWYPDDVWRGVLAAQWQRIAQDEPFPGRCAEVGDELGSAMATARLARDLMRLCLLLARRWPPYAKWLGSAFAGLDGAAPIAAALTAAVRAGSWGERERYLGAALSAVAARGNASGLHEPLDDRLRHFHDRPFLVLGADRFAAALGGPRPAIDQMVDNTDVLSDPALTRTFVKLTG